MRQWISIVAVLAVVGCSGSSEPSAPGPPDVSGGTPSGGDSGGGTSGGGASTGAKSGADAGATTPTPKDDAGQASSDAGGDAAVFICGKKGDMGNELGVGKYCEGFGDCLGSSKAILCAVLGDPNAHFCTFQCTQGSTGTCGAGASCQCQGGQCGCLPDACK